MRALVGKTISPDEGKGGGDGRGELEGIRGEVEPRRVLRIGGGWASSGLGEDEDA